MTIRIGYPQLQNEVKLLRLAFLNVQSVPILEKEGVVPQLNIFEVLSIAFSVSPLLKWQWLMNLYQSDHQWLILRNLMEIIASSF